MAPIGAGRWRQWGWAVAPGGLGGGASVELLLASVSVAQVGRYLGEIDERGRRRFSQAPLYTL